MAPALPDASAGKMSDVVLGQVPVEAMGSVIVQNLVIKGFCTISTGLGEDVIEKVLADVKDLGTRQRFQKLDPLILDGLLGREYAVRVAELESPDVEEELRRDGEKLRALDHTLTDVGFLLEPVLPHVGIDASHRSLALVHESDASEDSTASPLTERDVHKWLTQFMRHKVMVIIFLGPAVGTLELRPHASADADAYLVQTTPGTMVVLRPDVLERRHSAPGRSVAVSSFFLQGAFKKSASFADINVPPAARALDEWMLARLEELKQKETENSIWNDQLIPRVWQKAMNHTFHKGQMIAVRGASCRFPCSEDIDTWFQASVAGPDYVTEVPLERWDHSEVYDPDPESWREYKSYCKHASFMEGVELFDCKMFGISPNEAKSMDPNQRLVLEVGYSALYSMGMRKKTLANSSCGVYVGNGLCEWNYVPRPADYGAFGATGGALSISAGRFSFCFGLKGPSMTLDTEASSGLTAVHQAAESVRKKGRGQANEFAVAIGVHLCLASLWWPSQCASGWLCREGRCFTFDTSAAGYVRGEGCAALTVKALVELVDGQLVNKDDNSTLIGCIAGATMNSNGMSASLNAPSGPAEQEAICEAIRSASVSPLDVDAVEVHGAGAVLADAIEVGSMLRAHRDEAHPDPLALLAVKTSMGNQVECGGIAGMLKCLFSGRHGHMTPNLHLQVCNPHIEAFDQPALLPTEVLEHRAPSAFVGVMSRGFGGSNVYVLNWAEEVVFNWAEEAQHHATSTSAPRSLPASGTATNARQRGSIQFWPGGGGRLEPSMLPRTGYSIVFVGTRGQWNEPAAMEDEGNGVFGYTMSLGEKMWERFQIWLDGDQKRALHPGRTKATKDCPVLGPTEEAASAGWCWQIDGRTEFVVGKAGMEPELLQIPTADAGKPGDNYRIRLQVKGQWRMVDWERLPAQDAAATPQVERGRYFIAASWDRQTLQEMTSDNSQPGAFLLDVGPLPTGSGEFQILRNEDSGQAFYPPVTSAGAENCEVSVLGPDDESHGRCFRIAAPRGACLRIELLLERSPRQVSWRLLSKSAAST